MNNFTLLAATVCCLFLLPACRQQEPTSWLSEPYADRQQTIARTVHDIFQAAAEKNIDKLESYHLHSPKFTKFDDGEHRDLMDAEQGRVAEREIFTAIDSFTFNLVDLKASVFDRTAVAAFVIDYKARLQGAPIGGKVRGTLVFVDDAGHWKIVHEHFSTY
ncbi:MAG TPA: nuclear transport factor 2 family protein [Saprospiraceae bacterium]|nr:nuclear transport factor 2 family protein [Saprospiraceae bacterium]HNL40238.1 nuclear transport factor 2 family protein [Saprospiraceae bacterium]